MNEEKNIAADSESLIAESIDADTEERMENQSHSHHHHHHHRHHSKAYYWYRRKMHKVKKFFRKHKALRVVLIALLLIVIVLAVVIGVTNAQKNGVDNTETVLPTAVENVSYINVKLPYFDAPQAMVDDAVIQYIHDDNSTNLYEMMQTITDKNAARQPKNIVITLGLDSLPLSAHVEKAIIEVSDNAEFSNPSVYDVTETGCTVELPFLYTGATYYYRANVSFSDGTSFTADSQFETAESPRLISLDGTLNVRDIGGWRTADGKRIRQGMLYRGAEIDGVYEKSLKISAQGIADAHSHLGIVSDFDLRGLTADVPQDSAFGTTTRHLVFDAYDYKTALTDVSHDYFRELFSALADESNYPVYLHCSYGLDRTGTACYLLEALLGLSYADLDKEFGLTCLTYFENNPWEDGSSYTEFLTAFNALPGNTPQEKAENYLLSCGVTEREIQQIKGILLED